jgi:hypothetical protein
MAEVATTTSTAPGTFTDNLGVFKVKSGLLTVLVVFEVV